MKTIVTYLLITGALIFNAFTYSANAQVPVLYGLTSTGGGHNSGTIIKYYQGIAASAMDVFDFDSSTSHAGAANYPGGVPFGNLIMATDGNLYGLTQYGGLNGYGTVFQFNPNTNTFTKKIDLTTTTGTNPQGSFIQASDGNLYATIYQGGVNGFGTIIKYSLTTGNVTKLYDFADQPDGSYPTSGLLEVNGVLYGTTSSGGASSYGTLFHFSLSGGNPVIDISFDNLNYGRNPYGTPIKGTDGKLYGMTNNNSTSDSWGTIYAFNTSSSSCVPVYTFPETNNVGGSSMGSLLQASNGYLYGLTTSGADIFHFDISSATATNDYIFQSGTDGSYPLGSLIQATDGWLYGVTSADGANSDGVLFNYNYTTTQFNPLVQFNAVTGGAPNGSLLQVGTITVGINELEASKLAVFPNPATSNINLTGLTFNGREMIEITDVSGKVANAASATILSDKAELDIANLAAGMYIITVKQSGTTYTGRFIKTN